MQLFKNYFIILLFNSFLFSCATKKNIIYFQDDNKIEFESKSYIEETIKKNDILNINVSALDMTSVTPFLKDKVGSYNENQRLIDGFKVDEKGEINLPLIGKIKISGMTEENAERLLEKSLREKIIDPVVNITILTYRVTVLGEVKNPGTFEIYNPKINLIQAIGLAGDITINGKRKNITLIREINGKKIKNNIDLTKTDFLESDYYYLKNNDIIYIEPSYAKIKNSGYIGQISNVATIFSLIMSIIILARN